MEEVPGTGPVPSPHAALSEAAEVYFTAIQKIGEQALQSSTSQILGEGLPSSALSPHRFLGPGGYSSSPCLHPRPLPAECAPGHSARIPGASAPPCLPCSRSWVPEGFLL